MPNYYDSNAKEFIEATINVDMSLHYGRFLSFMKAGARILDLGCGSGRDSLYFQNNGYDIEAIDGSLSMVEQTSKLIGRQVKLLLFQDLDFKEEFDGIWASASLLHVKKEEMADVFTKVHEALKPEGILYCSFKDRPEDYIKDQRWFSCYNKESFTAFIETLGLFEILDLYSTIDSRPSHENEGWINGVLKKK